MTLTLADVLAGHVPDGVHGWSDDTTAAGLATACAGAGWALVHLGAPVAKGSVLAAFATGFALPGWTGTNWDALEEALGDLAPGRYLVVLDDLPAGSGDDARVLHEVLADVTQEWAAREGRFVVLLRGTDHPDHSG